MKKIPTPFAFTLALLAFAALTVTLHAQTTFQWSSTSSGTWDSTANWGGSEYPGDNAAHPGGTSTDIAEFTSTTGLQTTVTVSGSSLVNLGQITFDAGAPAYTIVTSTSSSSTDTSLGSLYINGAGIINNSGITQTLQGNITFLGSASVGSDITLQNSGTGSGAYDIYFGNSSNAGSANIVVGDQLQFQDTASAGSATITNTGAINIAGTSTAGSAKITNNGGLYVMNHTGGLTIGEVSGAGSIYLGSNTLTLGGLNTDATISGSISGDGGLTKIGTGTQTLTGANTYTGITTISAGTLQIGDGGAIAGDIVDSSALVFNRSDVSTYAGAISGTGTVTKSGSGTLTLSGANTYSGGTTLAGGTLSLGSSGALGSTGTISFTGGTLQYSASNTTDYSNRFSTAGSQAYAIDTNGRNVTLASALTSSGGTLTKSGTGTLTLSGANTYTGGTTLAGGTLSLGSSGALGSTGTISFTGGTLQYSASNTTDYSNRFSTAGSQAYALDTNGQNVTLASALTSSGGTLTKSGTGTLTLTGANTYSGTTTISAGTLQIGDGGTTGSIAGNIVDSSALAFDRSDDLSYAGAISGTGMLAKSGAGTLTLSGANSYSGATVIAGGTLSLGSSGALGSSGTISFTGGTLQYSASNTTDYSSRFNTTASQAYAIDTNGQNVTLASALTSSGGTFTKSGTGTLTLTGANTYSGTTTVSGGTLQLGNGGAAGSIAGDLANSSAVTFNRSDDTTYAGVISGTGSMTKTGSGALTLSGVNTYSGATTINAGKLILDGSIANSAVTVTNGGILGGSGIVGALTIGSGGVLAPGNSPGILQAGDTTFAGGGSFQWEIKDTNLILGTPTWDILNVTGGLSITASAGDRFTIDVTSLTTGNVSGDAFNFNSGTSYEIPFVQVAGGITGFDASAFVVDTTHFTNAFTGTWSVGMSNDGQYLTVNYSAVPEPATSAALAGFAVLLIAGYRRRYSRRIAAMSPRA